MSGYEDRNRQRTVHSVCDLVASGKGKRFKAEMEVVSSGKWRVSMARLSRKTASAVVSHVDMRNKNAVTVTICLFAVAAACFHSSKSTKVRTREHSSYCTRHQGQGCRVLEHRSCMTEKRLYEVIEDRCGSQPGYALRVSAQPCHSTEGDVRAVDQHSRQKDVPTGSNTNTQKLAFLRRLQSAQVFIAPSISRHDAFSSCPHTSGSR